MADEHLAEVPVVERGVDGLADRRVNREAVIVRGDLHLAGGQVLDGLVDAAMAELELVGAEAECAAEQLIAEADAEERVAGVQDLAQQLDLGVGLLRVAGAVGEEHAVRVQRGEFLESDSGRHDVHAAAALGHAMRGHALDSEIHGGDGVERLLALVLATRLDRIRLLGADLVVQAQTLHLRGGLDLVDERGDGLQAPFVVEQRVTGEDSGTHDARGAQVAHQLAGVDVADADDALGDEIVVKAARGPPIADGGAGIANHVSSHPDTGGFWILPVDSRVPDVRERLHHDLPIVTGIGQSLLITGHAGREHDLASGLADRAVRVTHIHLPVLKYKHGVIRGKTHGFGINLVHQNPLIFSGYSYQP